MVWEILAVPWGAGILMLTIPLAMVLDALLLHNALRVPICARVTVRSGRVPVSRVSGGFFNRAY